MSKYLKSIALILSLAFVLAGCDSSEKSLPKKASETTATVAKEAVTDGVASSTIVKLDEKQKPELNTAKSNGANNESTLLSGPTVFIGVIFLLIATNILTLLIARGIFRWRKVVKDGMNAIVPSQLLNDFDKIKSDQSKQGNSINENMKRIADYLGGTAESISILKKELESKEAELARLRDFQDSSEKEMLIKKVIRLHSLLTRMEHHVSSGGINNSSAIDFLSEELSDIFVDFGIQVISPSIGQKASDFGSEALSIAGFNATNNQQTHLTINEVNDVGYLYTSLSGGSKVLKPAVVILNKFGE